MKPTSRPQFRETHDIEEIKRRLSPLQLLRHHHIEVPEGKYMICSPIRQEKTPSFHVGKDDRTWYDFGCGVGGSVIDLQMKLTDCDLATAIASCAVIAGVQAQRTEDIEGSPLSRVPPPPRRNLIEPRSDLLSLEKARSLRVNLRYLLDNRKRYPNPPALRTLSWIEPVHLRNILRRGWLGATGDGKLAYVMRRGYKFRGDPRSSRADRWELGKAKDNLFFSYLDDEDILNPEKTTLILCEGESDSFAATIMFGDRCKIAGCLSASIVPPADMLYPLMRGCDRVVLMMDGDDAGRGLATKLTSFIAINFPWAKVEKFPMPEGKDLKKLYTEGNTADVTSFVIRPEKQTSEIQ